MNHIIENHITFDYLFCVGDTHGKNLQLASHLLPNVPKESKKAILHVGDFGMGFSSHVGEIDNMAHLDKKLKKDNVWLYVIRGNHDNPAYFDSNNSKHQDMDRFDNVILIPDHTLLSLQTVENDNLRIYCLGGAVSVDRTNRTPSKGYWWNEIVPRLTEKELDKIPSDIDIVLTHTRPKGVFPVSKNNIWEWLDRDHNLEYDLDEELDRISEVFEVLYKRNLKGFTHYYGHFHMSNTEFIGKVKHQLLNIDELIEVKPTHNEYVKSRIEEGEKSGFVDIEKVQAWKK